MKIDLTDERNSTEQYQVNAFSDRPFCGNPAAVVFKHRDPIAMQGIAMENNLSETAFVKLRPDTVADFDIRW
jgi:PhzF family phenazine biosynthesis protein